MARGFLDEKLKNKLATKLKKSDVRAINVMVSKKAAKLGISSEAALIVIAKENGIGTANFQRKLDPAKQTEVRDALPTLIAKPRGVTKGGNSEARSKPRSISRKESLRAAIEYVVQDQELLERCGDILAARSKFDRAVNQATLVLEDRIRNKAKPSSRLVGENLVNYAFNEEISKTRLQVSSKESDDQRGLTQILRGVVPAFRNKTHHHLVDTMSREEALRICGFIDVLLRLVDSSERTAVAA
jgi:uncharacterized protein (TIGR02391 family)